jgi:sulfide:quinone oxidoreductase
VDPETLQHIRYPQVFALGDVCSTSNAKTAAAARKQIVVVAENLLAVRDNKPLPLRYDGYGSCPLTVEKGKVVLAEFGYGGKLLPTFPLDATVARKSAWFLKARFLPWFYWNGMLKGREWLTSLSKAR